MDALLRPAVAVTVVVDRARLLAEVARTAAGRDAKRQNTITITITLTLAAAAVRVSPLLEGGAPLTGPDLPARLGGMVGLTLAFRPGYLTDALRCFTGDTVALHLTTPVRPVTLTDAPDGITDPRAYRHLVMPVRLPDMR